MPQMNATPEQNDGMIRTVADDLFDMVKKSSKISIEEVAKHLKVSMMTVQTLVDFLVEEKILGIEYKFTTPYIYIYKDALQKAKSKDKSFAKGLVTKEQFYDKAKKKKIPYEIIEGLWRKYLQQNLSDLRTEFLRVAKDKKVSDNETEELWEKYLTYL